jgi:two-component system, response regulator PdtaR
MQVLVVEDDLMLADCLAEALTDDGHVVCGVAWTVDDAVALARLHRPDVAVLDMQLRGKERGSDVVEQLRESHDLGDMGILYVTGEAERVLRESGVGHACLSKPYRFSTLGTALQIVCEIAHQGRTTRALPRGLRLLPLTTTDLNPRSDNTGVEVDPSPAVTLLDNAAVRASGLKI